MNMAKGRGRGVILAKVRKDEPSFVMSAPIKVSWANAENVEPFGAETGDDAGQETKTVNLNGGGAEGQFGDYNSEFEVDNRQLNPEEKLELANHQVGEYQKEEENEERPENGESSSDIRSFTFTKLHFDPKVSQAKRREHILSWQKKRRDEFLEKIRHFENDNWSGDEMDEENDFVKYVEKRRQSGPQQWSGRQNVKPTARRWNDHARIMLSEWMAEKPENFEEDWVGILVPVGQRVLIIASRGKTRVVSRRGYFLGEFQSFLPSGRKYHRNQCLDGPSRGVTILDCQWAEESKIFYVMDILCWNSTSTTDYDTECRVFFLKSRFGDLKSAGTDLTERSDQNPFPFKPLDFFPVDELPVVMSVGSPPFPDKVDGVLFFHKQTRYIYEATNPLCLWIHLSKVPTMLGIDVSPELLEREREPKPPREPRELKPSREPREPRPRRGGRKQEMEVTEES